MKKFKVTFKDSKDIKTIQADLYKIENGFCIFESNNTSIFTTSADNINSIENIQTINESNYTSSEMICD